MYIYICILYIIYYNICFMYMYVNVVYGYILNCKYKLLDS